MAKEDELYQAALEKGSASADEVTKWGAGGGNVTEDFGNVVSIAGKFGIRNEEVGHVEIGAGLGKQVR